MTAPTFPRRAAAFLLRSAISIAPRDTIDWGNAMLSELCHVEGNWSALLWSLGSIGVLAKRALVTALFGDANCSIVPSEGHPFFKEAPVRKVTLYTTTACIIALLLFFVAPVFRQAFRVSLAQWHDVFHVQARFTEGYDDAVLKDLGRRAEQNHDAEALAFVALRMRDRFESARLADEAVNLDPNLIWVYAAAETYYLPSFDQRHISALEQWDPQNALPHLIAAERIDLDRVGRAKIPHSVNEEPAAWRDAMAAAFLSPKLDTYVERQKHLDRRVLARYQIDDPFQAVSYQNWYALPSYASEDSSRYAELLLDAGKSLEAHGDRKAASAKYLTVARFAQVLEPWSRLLFRKQLKEALIRLGSLSQVDGNKEQAAFYRALADQLDRAWETQVASWQSTYRGSDLSHWNALLVRLSGSLMLLFGALLTLCLIGVIIRSRSLRLTSLRPSGLTLALAFMSALGAVLASAVLLVSYWPYSHVLRRFVSAADESGLSELSNFLFHSQLPLGSGFRAGSWYVGMPIVVYYFWLGVTVLCALVLLAAVLRHLQTRPRDATL